MSGIMAVASREIEERKAWLLASLAFGLVQLGLPFVAADVPSRDLIAAGLSLAVPLAMALALGSTIIATDIGERRLGFYFSRPLSGLAIWGGKVLGAIVLTAAATALVAGPVVWATGDLPGGIHTAVFVAPLFLVFLAHVIASAVRSRSGLLPVDFVLLAAVAAVAAVTIQSLLKAGAQATLFLVGPWAAGSVIAILMLAGLAQVVSGRPDPRRGHRALSIVLWGGLGVGVLAFAGFARWVLAVTPAEVGLVDWRLQLPPRGSVFLLGGNYQTGAGRAGFAPPFWIDASTGTWAPGPAALWCLFSKDGRTAVWLEEEPLRLAHARLDSLPARVDRVQPSESPGWLIAVSPDGSQVVVHGEKQGEVSLLEVATGRLVGTTPGRPASWPAVDFLPDGRVRLFTASYDDRAGRDETGLEVSDWSVSTGVVERRASFVGPVRLLDIEGDRLLLSNRAEKTFSVHDLVTGLDLSLPRTTKEATFLANGSVALVGRDGASVSFATMSPDGMLGEPTPLGTFDTKGIGLSEPAPGLVSIGWYSRWGVGSGVYVVDVATHRVLRYEASLAFSAPGRGFSPVGERHAAPGSLPTRLFVDAAGALVDFDPVSGSRRIVVPGPAS